MDSDIDQNFGVKQTKNIDFSKAALTIVLSAEGTFSEMLLKFKI